MVTIFGIQFDKPKVAQYFQKKKKNILFYLDKIFIKIEIFHRFRFVHSSE